MCSLILQYFIYTFLECPAGYQYFKSEKLCLGINLALRLDFKDSSCSQSGGVPFVRRMSDDLLNEIKATVKEYCDNNSPVQTFIGKIFPGAI